MKKRGKKDKFSTSEVGALAEALRDEIKPLLEDIPEIKKKLDGVFEQVGKNTERLGPIETVVKKNTEEIRLNRQLIHQVLDKLKAKVDQKDFAVLEKKVASLIR